MEFSNFDYGPEVTALLKGMEADLQRIGPAENQPSGLKAKADARIALKAKVADCERELAAAEAEQSDPAALDKALKAIAADAADRGDVAGAILAMSFRPKRAGEP
jgi:hypothetical protein